jgi:hypothetical protein
MHVMVTWETFFEAANSWIAGNWHGIPIPAVAPQRLMAIVNGKPAPKVATLQLGKGSGLGVTNSGLVAVYIENASGDTRTELQLNKGLRWQSTIENGRLIYEEAPPPAYWPSTGSKIALVGGASNMQFAHMTNGSSVDVHAIFNFMLFKSGAIDKEPIRQQEHELTIPAGGVVPVGNFELLFDGLKSGSYVPAILVEVQDIPNGSYYILMPPITIKEEPEEPEPGMLDCVFCIDKSGSMIDDIEVVKKGSDIMLEQLDAFASEKNISLQVGLVTYTRHDEPNWIQAWQLTSDVEQIRQNINKISITDPSVGKGGNEDIYGAVMYAMNQNVGGQWFEMGWRSGAAKVIMPIGDEPPADPDWESRKLTDVARVAKDLDPVHMYPLLLPKHGLSFLDPAVRGMERIAKATKGQVVQVNEAKDLPDAIVTTVQLAVRQHRNEVWRQKHPPYVLYFTLFGVIGLAIASMAALSMYTLISHRHINKTRSQIS